MSEPKRIESETPAAVAGAARGSPAQWQELALAALKVCYYRPHPREWWDGDMREDREKEYDAACKRMGELKKELGLENDQALRPEGQ